MSAAHFLVWLSLFGAFYAYIGYPLMLRWLIQRRIVDHPEPSIDLEERPSEKLKVSIIITVRNEAQTIRDKLGNTLALLYDGKPASEGGVQIIVASDASDDETDAIVREYASSGVELVRLPERGGKEVAQRAAVEHATGDILIFTDAKIRLKPDAIERFISYYRDPEIGAVSSIDRLEDAPGGGSGEGFYIRYEMWLRSLESQFQTLVGLSGSCFSVKRQVARNIRTDIPSDFALLIESRRQRLRGVHASDIIATYGSVGSAKAEFSRKVRTVLRGITTLFQSREVMNPLRYGSFSWQIMSHKLCRWLVPWFLLVALVGTFTLAPGSCLYSILALGMLGFMILALLAQISPRLRRRSIFRAPLFFIVVNAAILIAWLRYLCGERAVRWNPSNR